MKTISKFAVASLLAVTVAAPAFLASGNAHADDSAVVLIPGQPTGSSGGDTGAPSSNPDTGARSSNPDTGAANANGDTGAPSSNPDTGSGGAEGSTP
ncbi:MAG TPA: hypothetical protein VGO04_23290 [Ensifer sp.]|jgi:hypothetical protein|uniref:hypothetical protein n=1 Tax=Ensifer sp. TaxID=1872086 RepID=UPI002E10CD19|nr:hypothetical protein [Ensifer sp.]